VRVWAESFFVIFLPVQDGVGEGLLKVDLERAAAVQVLHGVGAGFVPVVGEREHGVHEGERAVAQAQEKHAGQHLVFADGQLVRGDADAAPQFILRQGRGDLAFLVTLAREIRVRVVFVFVAAQVELGVDMAAPLGDHAGNLHGMGAAVDIDRHGCRHHHRVGIDARVELLVKIALEHRHQSTRQAIGLGQLLFGEVFRDKDQHHLTLVHFAVARLRQGVAGQFRLAAVPVIAPLLAGIMRRGGRGIAGAAEHRTAIVLHGKCDKEAGAHEGGDGEEVVGGAEAHTDKDIFVKLIIHCSCDSVFLMHVLGCTLVWRLLWILLEWLSLRWAINFGKFNF